MKKVADQDISVICVYIWAIDNLKVCFVEALCSIYFTIYSIMVGWVLNKLRIHYDVWCCNVTLLYVSLQTC